MRVEFFSVPALALASSCIVACSGSDASKAAADLGLGGLANLETGTGGQVTSSGTGGTTSVGTTTLPPPTGTGGSWGVGTVFGTGGTTGTGTTSLGTGNTTSTLGTGGSVGSLGTGGIPTFPSSTGGASSTGGTTSVGTGGMTSVGGATSSSGGSTGSAGSGSGGSGPKLMGMCCSDGNCLCHGTPPSAPTSMNGPYKTASFPMTTGTVYYPTDAEPPLAGVSICPGFLNTGPEMTAWGPFYASWGIVTVVTTTGALDLPAIRGNELVAAITELKKQNTTSSSPLNGKLAGRYGTSGYSMGGGGTTFASEADPTMRTSVGLAAWGPDGTTDKVPTLFICSDADSVASCLGSTSSYAAMPSPTPKMILDIPNETHFNWFSPTDAGFGESGAYALAFQKVYLEGDDRWKPVLQTMPKLGTLQMANVQ